MAGNASGNVIVTIDHVEKIYQGRSGEVVALMVWTWRLEKMNLSVS